MKRIIGLLIIAIFLLGCQKQESPEITPAQLEEEMDISEIVEPAEEKEEFKVIIEDSKFDPKTLTIPKGTRIAWINKESAMHTITSEEGLFDSDLMSKGTTFSHIFNEQGIFEYYCKIHPGMRARIIVE